MSYLLHHTPHTQLDDSGLWQMAVCPWTVSFQILLASGPSITITRGGPWIKEWVQRPPWLCVPEQHCITAHEVGVSCEKLFNSRTKRQFIGMRTRTLSTRTIPTWTLRPRELVPTLKRKEKVLREGYRSGFERRDAFVPTLESGTHLTFLLLASTGTCFHFGVAHSACDTRLGYCPIWKGPTLSSPHVNLSSPSSSNQ